MASSQAVPACGVIVPCYLCATNKATKPLCCLPAIHLPASYWQAGAGPRERGSTSASSQSGKTTCKAALAPGHQAATGSWHCPIGPATTLGQRRASHTSPCRRRRREGAGKLGGVQGVPTTLPCGHWHWDTLLLVAPSQVLPKYTLSSASTEGCKPGKSPANLQVPQGLICTFCLA